MGFTRKIIDHLKEPGRFVDLDAHPYLATLTVATLTFGPCVPIAAAGAVAAGIAAEGTCKVASWIVRWLTKRGPPKPPKPKPYVPPPPPPTKAERVAAAWQIYTDNMAIIEALPDSSMKQALMDREVTKRDELIEQALDVP
ncbi:MAG: hypothetical protein H7831_08380 [Magnetococcus sp. WYHC-3]